MDWDFDPVESKRLVAAMLDRRAARLFKQVERTNIGTDNKSIVMAKGDSADSHHYWREQDAHVISDMKKVTTHRW